MVKKILSKLFGLGVRIDRGRKLRHAYRSCHPVLSVGNISSGGTGKTPVLMWLITELQKYYPLIVLSRGYGRDSRTPVVWKPGEPIPSYREIGDEPCMIAGVMSRGLLGISADRAELLRLYEGTIPGAVVLLDDGFQHHLLQRDIDIVIVDDATALDRNLLPLGRLRELPGALKRATIVLATSDVSEKHANTFVSTGAAVYRLDYGQPSLHDFGGIELSRPPVDNVVVVTGIANPQRVVGSAESLGLNVVRHLFFRDHHRYTGGDVDAMLRVLRETGAGYLVTTTKDFVKLGQYQELQGVLLILKTAVHFPKYQQLLEGITSVVASHQQ